MEKLAEPVTKLLTWVSNGPNPDLDDLSTRITTESTHNWETNTMIRETIQEAVERYREWASKYVIGDVKVVDSNPHEIAKLKEFGLVGFYEWKDVEKK